MSKLYSSATNAFFRVASVTVASSSSLYFIFGNDQPTINKVQCEVEKPSRIFFNVAGSGGNKNSKLVAIQCADGTKVIPYQPPDRKEQLNRLRTECFDVLVIGGGCTGSGVALDASKRGLRVAMIEQDDFGSGTSGRSTKLIHGGIRYLENAFKNLDYEQYELVQEALEERRHMLKCAPYMNKPLPIMIPMYKHKWYDILRVPYYLAGAWVYDFVAGRDSGVPSSHFINKQEALYQFPMIEDKNLLGAIVYYDGQMNDTRMCLHLALTATQLGAAIASRMKVISLLHNSETGQCCGATVQDTVTNETFTIKARAVVNATGVFADSIRQMDNSSATPIIKGAAGVHVVLPDHYSPTKMGLIVPQTSDGRVLFFLPWEGGTIAGTTDAESELTMTPRPTDKDIGFILMEANNYLRNEKTVSTDDVRSAWSGIRPLVIDPSQTNAAEDTKSISRSHVIEVSKPGKLVTIAGGKWTTYRRMAEDTVDRVLLDVPECAHGRAIHRECETKDMGIIGADRAGIVTGGKFDRIVVTLREEYGLPKDVAYHLVHNYGTRALQIGEITRSGSEVFDQRYISSTGDVRRISSRYPYLEAEVKFAVEQEYALTAIDVLARRTRLAYIDSEAARHATTRVVDIMGDILGWNKIKRKQEEADCLKWLDTMNMEEKGRK